MSSYPFGFLSCKATFRFVGGEITPTDDYDAALQWVAKYKHKDGFIYPPWSRLGTKNGEIEPNTERPAQSHSLPASHLLRFESNVPSSDPSRMDASLVMQLTAYLFGTWLQFEDWRFDTRVPMGRLSLHCSRATIEHFLSHAYATWGLWREAERRRFVTLLFMFNRAPSYAWDWEHFAVEYMVFDALYKTATELNLTPGTKIHAKRIDQLCSTFNIPENVAKQEQFVDLRNDLMHETLWDGGQPGSSGSTEAFLCQFDLRRLNQRLIPAILGYDNDFVRSDWWTVGQYAFTEP